VFIIKEKKKKLPAVFASNTKLGKIKGEKKYKRMLNERLKAKNSTAFHSSQHQSRP
jgi:hypothetical protein